MAKGLLAILGMKSKPGAAPEADDAPPSSQDEGGSSATEYADMAFDAMRDGDKEGFRTAFLGAIKSCKGSGGGYEE